MARGGNSDTAVVEPEVETPVSDEAEDISGTGEASADGATEKPAKKVKEPARGDLPEGYVTPVGLAKILTEKKMHTDRDGNIVEVAPQMVYSYIKNAPKEHPFPLEKITDSIGKVRDAVRIDAALDWWEKKNARAAERKASAAAKAQAKAAKAAAKPAEGEAAADQTPVATEAE